MAFYSGFQCESCKKIKEYYGHTADEVHSITHLRRFARNSGWLVGKKKVLCEDCRKK